MIQGLVLGLEDEGLSTSPPIPTLPSPCSGRLGTRGPENEAVLSQRNRSGVPQSLSLPQSQTDKRAAVSTTRLQKGTASVTAERLSGTQRFSLSPWGQLSSRTLHHGREISKPKGADP